jgi:hypothetical protein
MEDNAKGATKSSQFPGSLPAIKDRLRSLIPKPPVPLSINYLLDTIISGNKQQQHHGGAGNSIGKGQANGNKNSGGGGKPYREIYRPPSKIPTIRSVASLHENEKLETRTS